MKKAITLIELILAMVLLMTIILSATSLDVATHYFFRSSDLKAKIFNEASLVAEHIAKNAIFSAGEGGLGASSDDGNITQRGFSLSSGSTLIIRQDLKSSNNYYQPLNTPEDTSDDQCVKYVFNSSAHTVTYYKYASRNCSGTPLQTVLLTDKLVTLGSGNYLDYSPAANSYRVSLYLKLRSNPSLAADSRTNPQVELRTSFFVH